MLLMIGIAKLKVLHDHRYISAIIVQVLSKRILQVWRAAYGIIYIAFSNQFHKKKSLKTRNIY